MRSRGRKRPGIGLQQVEPYERFSQMHIESGIFFAVRADGNNFHALTRRMKKPYDEQFRRWMNETLGEYLLHHLSEPFFAFTFSDEFTLLFRKEENLFARRVEKLDSLIGSALSAIFARKASTVAFFDARVAILPRFEDVVNYLEARQVEARRDCINSHTFYDMVRSGLSGEQAAEAMREWNFNRMNKYLRDHNAAFRELPLWQRRGEAFYWETYRRPGFNPLTGKRTVAKRFKLLRNDALPRFASSSGRRLLRRALEARAHLVAAAQREEPTVQLRAGWEVV